MKKLLTLILAGMLSITMGLCVACAPAPAPEGPTVTELDFGVSFTSTSWADSEKFLDVTLCANSEARIVTEDNAEVVNGLRFVMPLSAEAYAMLTAEDVEIGALLCPVSEINDMLQFDDNEKIASIKLYEKVEGVEKLNGIEKVGDDYQLVCHVRDIPAAKNTLDIGCVFYVKSSEGVEYAERIDSTLEVAALNSLNSGAYEGATVTALEALVKSKTLTLTFDANGGSAVSSIKVIKGAMLEDVLANIESSLKDMQFVKWQMVTVGEDGAEVLADYNEQTAVNEDIKLKAVFTNPLIATAEDFMAAVNAGAGSYTFTADIDLTEYMATNPWAGERYIEKFAGSIDGAGYKLTGITGMSDGQTANYGFFGHLSGTLTNLYIELDVKYPAWNGAGYGKVPFGTIASWFYGSIENCVISFSQSLESGSIDLNNVGLFSYFCKGASMEDVLLIDRTTDPSLTKSALLTSVVAGGHYDLDISNVVYVKTNGITDYTDMMMPWSHDAYEPAEMKINNFYVVADLADATVEGAGYVLSDAYLTGEEYTNDETTWTANTAVAADCLNVVTFADNKVMFGEVEIAEYFVPQPISTGEELFNLFNSGVTGSYYLTNDIDMYELMETEAYSWGVDGANGIQYAPTSPCADFNATLDGRNYKITGIHGIDGGNANYGLIRNFFGTITNCYIEIAARYTAGWQGTYGKTAFGTLANNFYGEISNCVIKIVATSNGSAYHKAQGLFAQVSESATIKNVLIIDDSTDAWMEFRPLLSGYAAYVGDGSGWAYEDVEDVVYVRTNLGLAQEVPSMMNGFAYLLPAGNKSYGINDFYVADSFEEAITENGSYTLSDDYYNAEITDSNSEAYWTKSSNVAMNCLSGITYKEGVVKLNGRAVYEVPEVE